MRRTIGLGTCVLLVAAACGGSDATTGETVAPSEGSTPVAETVVEPTPESAPDPEPAPEPETTEAPAPDATTIPEPEPEPVPINVVGLVPLPGVQLDFAGRAVANPSLVWSLFSGSGGLIVENVGGPIPPGCHGTSFFDPATFELLQIDGADANAYASRGEGGCANMQQDLDAGVVDGDAVAVNDDNFIVFDFGALPPPPFDVSTQVVNPEGNAGIFRSGDPDTPLIVNDLTGADYAVGVGGIYEIGSDGTLSRHNPSPTEPGPGCPDLGACVQNGRMWVDVIATDGSPAGVSNAGDQSGLFFFDEPDSWEVLVSVLNGCAINNHFWVFAAATTDVEYEFGVTDALSSTGYSVANSFGVPTLDTQAFATCP